MRNEWSSLINLGHDSGSPHIFPIESQLSQGFGLNILQQFGTLVDNSFHGSKQICVSGNLALQETFNRLNKFVGSLFVQLSAGSNKNLFCRLSSNSHESHSCGYQSQIKNVTSYLQILSGLHFGSGSKDEHYIPVILAKLASSTLGRFWREIEKNHSFHILSLAGALVPPFENLSAKVLAESVTLVNNDEQINGVVDRSLRENNNRGCLSRTITNITSKDNAIEPKTGIKFPTALEDNSSLPMEVLVGTGFRSMKIIKLKSLKVYAFGLYIHPESVCQKLGRKYSSVPISELMNCSDFFKDLLREDISMTVRLVVNCNGIKINSVRAAFEKSLRTRLQKVNPETDFHCLTTFGSYFTRDIPIPMGTTIDFRQTADGQLITKIGGEHIGAVHSKDLCKAFFDMYIGDLPVSLRAKEEIAQNVADLIRKC